MKKIIAFILLIFSLFMAVVIANKTNNKLEKTVGDYYSLTTVVTNFDIENDIVICTDFVGNEWKFGGIADWHIGEIASFVMNNNGTKNIFDDKIVAVNYCGWLDGNWGYDNKGKTVFNFDKQKDTVLGYEDYFP